MMQTAKRKLLRAAMFVLAGQLATGCVFKDDDDLNVNICGTQEDSKEDYENYLKEMNEIETYYMDSLRRNVPLWLAIEGEYGVYEWGSTYETQYAHFEHDYKGLLPDATETLPDGKIIGLKDMGLPSGTKWAVENLDIDLKTTDFTSKIDPMATLEEEGNLPRPTIAVNFGEDTIVRYKDYDPDKYNTSWYAIRDEADRHSGQVPFGQLVYDYRQKWKKYMDEGGIAADMRDVAQAYYGHIASHYQWLYANSDYYYWGQGTAGYWDPKRPLKDIAEQEMTAETDPATLLWGSQWATPTPEQWQELIDNCTLSFMYVGPSDRQGSGKIGVVLTSKRNGQQLFLPTTANSVDKLTSSQGDIYGYLTNRRYDETQYICCGIGQGTMTTTHYRNIDGPSCFARAVRR